MVHFSLRTAVFETRPLGIQHGAAPLGHPSLVPASVECLSVSPPNPEAPAHSPGAPSEGADHACPGAPGDGISGPQGWAAFPSGPVPAPHVPPPPAEGASGWAGLNLPLRPPHPPSHPHVWSVPTPSPTATAAELTLAPIPPTLQNQKQGRSHDQPCSPEGKPRLGRLRWHRCPVASAELQGG